MRRLLVSVLLGLVLSVGTTAAAYADPPDKVELNHNGHTITVSVHAANKHLAHGDTVVICGDCGW